MITILTGPVHAGKTTFLRTIAGDLAARDLAPAGFLSLARFSDGERAGYDLLDLSRGIEIPFVRPEGRPEWQQIGCRRPHFILPGGLAAAEEIIAAGDGSRLFIVDEVGPLELRGGGFWPALEKVLFPPEGPYLLVSRRKTLPGLLGLLESGNRRVDVLDLQDRDEVRRTVEAIAAADR